MTQLANVVRETADRAAVLVDNKVVPITIYGTFSGDENQYGKPDHTWFEYNGWLYDTMPGTEIYKVPVNEKNPGCLFEGFPAETVIGSTQSHLTWAQYEDCLKAKELAPVSSDEE
jgi:hypothetical protein